MGHLRKADNCDVTGVAVARAASAVMWLPNVISEVRIQGAFGSYLISWDAESHDLELPPLEISDGPYMTFKGALRAARRKVRKDRRELHEEIIEAQWGR